MRSRWVCRIGFVVGVCAYLVPALLVAAETREEQVRFALRRAALELTAGRPRVASELMARLAPDANRHEEEALAQLLWAEAELLSGRTENAGLMLRELLDNPHDFVRAQCAAHLLAIQAVAPDGHAEFVLRTWETEKDHFHRIEFQDAAAGQLLALELVKSDPVRHRSALRELSRGPAAVVGQLIRAESLIDAGRLHEAEKQFAKLESLKHDPFSGWTRDWARIGQARSLWGLGREEEAQAFEVLDRVEDTRHLAAYARWMQAQIAWLQEDWYTVREKLEGLSLENWNSILACEAHLAAAQLELKRGAYARAESLADAFLATFSQRFHEGEFRALFDREIQIDIDSWHAARTRSTLARLTDSDLLRHTPWSKHLQDSGSAIVMSQASAHDSSSTRLTLLRPYRHAREILAYAPEAGAAHFKARLAWRRVLHLEREAKHVLGVLDDKRHLASQAREQLEAQLRELEAMAQEAAVLEVDLGEYRKQLQSQSQAWQNALHGRLSALGAMLEELEHAVARLEARYPQDRTLRPHEAVDNAWRTLPAARAWVVQLKQLESELQSRHASRIHQVLGELEPEAQAAKLEGLKRTIDDLQQRTRDLAVRVGLIDFAESSIHEELQREIARARERWQSFLDEALRISALLDAERHKWHEARATAYLQAARDLATTSVFLAAVEDSSGNDPERLARLENAALRLKDFLHHHPAAGRGPEMLYRLGEVELQRAAIRHRLDLARFLESGGEADDVPLPIESYAAAVEAFERLLRQFPASPRVVDAHFQLGFLYAEMMSPVVSNDNLTKYLELALANDERRGAAALRLGDNHVFLKDLPAAFDAFQLATSSTVHEVRDLAFFKLGWLAYELDRYEVARQSYRTLLEFAEQSTEKKSRARELRSEALELLALAFAEDHVAAEAALVLDEWGRPSYDFALLRRMAQLFAGRALYGESIAAYQVLFDRHPLHPGIAGVADTWIQLVERHEGPEEAHELSADLALHFTAGGEWAMAVAEWKAAEEISPSWQSQLVEEQAALARADSLSLALSDPAQAAERMSKRLRAAAVYAHQAAKRDTAGSFEHYARAAELYEVILQRFPGSEDEDRTWLYLGESNYAVGKYEAAADAYGQAMALAADDSLLGLQAARQQLAALDAAAAARPDWHLERYHDTAVAFTAKHPEAEGGWDALERVGELAFKAEDYERSEQAYTRFAEGTADADRAAAALKSVADGYYRLGDFAAAAERYRLALHRARQGSHSDSLITDLEVLVPGSWYRAAQAFDETGDLDKAAAGFENVATGEYSFEFADQALYRAAELRLALGDSVTADDNYETLLRAHPQSELRADVLLNLGRLREARGETERSADTYLGFANQFPKHEQALGARIKAASLLADSHKPEAADEVYADILTDSTHAAVVAADTALTADLWMRRARLASSPATAAGHYEKALRTAHVLEAPDRAEAHFKVAEQLRPGYESIPLDQPINVSLDKKKTALETLLASYSSSMQENLEPWHAAAALRVGDALKHLGESLKESEPPAGLEGDDLWAYREALSEQAVSLEDRAVETWSKGLRAANENAHEDEWTKNLESTLYPLLARRVTTRPTALFVLVKPQENR